MSKHSRFAETCTSIGKCRSCLFFPEKRHPTFSKSDMFMSKGIIITPFQQQWRIKRWRWEIKRSKLETNFRNSSDFFPLIPWSQIQKQNLSYCRVVPFQIWSKHPSWFWRGLLLSASQEHFPTAKLDALKCKGKQQESPSRSNTLWSRHLGS